MSETSSVQRETWWKRNGFSMLLAIACAAFAVQVLLLSREVRGLRAVLAQSNHEHSDRQRVGLGERWPAFEVINGGGEREQLHFDERMLVCVFAEVCPVCPQMFIKWEELAALALPNTRTVGLVLGSGASTVPDELPQGFDSYVLAELSEVPLAKLSAVPITILIDAGGAVEWVHYGTMSDAVMEDLVLRL